MKAEHIDKLLDCQQNIEKIVTDLLFEDVTNSDELKDLQQLLFKIKQQLEKEQLEYFLVAAKPNTGIGASIYNGRGVNGGGC